MTLVATPSGFEYPGLLGSGERYGTTITATIDAAAEKYAMIGRVYIQDRGTSKTISAAGGGSISFVVNSVTFANGSTTIDVGLQDVDTTTGNPVRPDGTFDVKRTLTGGTDTITTNWNTFAMTGGSGTKTLSNGDLIAVVLDMTARGGADSVVFRGTTMPGQGAPGIIPSCVAFTASWAAINNVVPSVMITFDDGTLGMIDGGTPYGLVASNESFSDSTNPDERGFLFQVPWDCSIDALWAVMGPNAASSDFEVSLYTDPLGTPAAVSGFPISITAETSAVYASANVLVLPLPATVNLTRATDYVVAFKATGAGTVLLVNMPLPVTGARNLVPGGTTLAKVTRNNGTGAFTAESPAVTMYQLGVRICAWHDTSGGSGGGSRSRIQSGF